MPYSSQLLNVSIIIQLNFFIYFVIIRNANQSMPIKVERYSPENSSIITEEDVDSVETTFSRIERWSCWQYLKKMCCWQFCHCCRWFRPHRQYPTSMMLFNIQEIMSTSNPPFVSEQDLTYHQQAEI